jgi:Ca2+-binding RTX toxin-like protein
MFRCILGITLSGVVMCLAAARPASAAVSCAFNAGTTTLSVTATAAGDLAVLYRPGATDIGVATADDAPVPCSGGTPTVTTVDTISYADSSPGGTTLVVNAAYGSFGPGATGEGAGNVSEIEITADMGGGNDTLTVDTAQAGAHSRAGKPAAGKVALNLNVDENVADGDDVLALGAENVNLVGGTGVDLISGHGGAGTGSPLDGTTALRILGQDGQDDLTGGAGDDVLEGGLGNDTMHGQGGLDEMDGGIAGDDVFDGGDGFDTASWHESDVPVHVEAGLSGPQDTGAGNDSLIAIERIAGSTGDDVLRASPGGVNLDGGEGDDLLIGRSAGDALTGGPGSDTVDYSAASGPVSFDLFLDGAGVTGGAAGDDEIYTVENFVG